MGICPRWENRRSPYRRMHEELKAVGDSPRLALLIAQMVSKSLRMLAEKAEYMSAGGGSGPKPYNIVSASFHKFGMILAHYWCQYSGKSCLHDSQYH